MDARADGAKKGAITLNDVARLSGVSRAAASRALNGRNGVRSDVRERVLFIADSLKYRPNRAARHLVGGRASVIGLVIPSEELRIDPYGVALIQSVARAAEDCNEGLMLILAPSEPNKTVRTTLLDGLIDGVVVSSIAVGNDWVEELLDAPVPTVLIGAHSTRTDVHTVEVENFECSAAMVEHLIDEGFTRIATITGPLDRRDARQRLDGFRAAHQRRGLTVDEDLIVFGTFERSSGRDRMFDLLARRPDAVVAANDEMAVGAIHTIEVAGLTVPDDIAVVGFDGVASLDGLHSSLSTVRQPFQKMAELAVSALLSILDGETPPAHQVVVPELHLGSTSIRRVGSAP